MYLYLALALALAPEHSTTTRWIHEETFQHLAHSVNRCMRLLCKHKSKAIYHIIKIAKSENVNNLSDRCFHGCGLSLSLGKAAEVRKRKYVCECVCFFAELIFLHVWPWKNVVAIPISIWVVMPYFAHTFIHSFVSTSENDGNTYISASTVEFQVNQATELPFTSDELLY